MRPMRTPSLTADAICRTAINGQAVKGGTRRVDRRPRHREGALAAALRRSARLLRRGAVG